MKCLNCGADMPEDGVFCANCGVRANDVVQEVASTCPNCQNPLKPGAVFCGACGAKTGDAPAQVAPQYAPPVYAMPTPPPRAKKKGPLVAIIVVLVIVLAGAGVYALFGGAIRKAVLGTKGYYASVENKELKKTTSDLIGDVSQYTNTADKGGYDFEISLSDLNRDLLSSMGLDSSTATIYENLTLKNTLMFDRSGDAPKFFDKLDLATGDEVLLTAQGMIDSDQMIVGLPDFLPKYISATSDDLNALMSQSGMDVSALTGASGFDPRFNEAALKNTFSKIVDIMIKHVDTCEVNAGKTLEAGDVSAKYDCYTMTIENDSAKAMVIEIMQMLQNDDEVYKLYSQMSASSGTELSKEDFKQQLQDAIDQIENDDGTQVINIEQKVYINSAEEVVGRDLTITDGDDNSILAFQFAHPTEGNKEAVYYSFDAGTGAMEYLSEYTVTNGKKTGTATISQYGAEMAIIDFEDVVDQRIGSKDFTLGKFTLTMVGVPSPYTGGDMRVVFEATADGNAYVMDLSLEEVGAINIRYSEIAADKVSIPDLSGEDSVSISDESGLNDLITEDVMTKFTDLAAKLGLY